jgi:transposase
MVMTLAMPPQPLPGSVADAATIATVMTGKYADGMPLYRMEAASRAPASISAAARWDSG